MLAFLLKDFGSGCQQKQNKPSCEPEKEDASDLFK
jgi:hypothetical protein